MDAKQEQEELMQQMPNSPRQRIAEELVSALLVNSLSTVRQTIGVRAGLTHDGRRDIYQSCGYPVALTVFDYYGRYRRGDVGRRVVDAFPKACWQEHPEVWDVDETQEAGTPAEEAPATDPALAYANPAGANPGNGTPAPGVVAGSPQQLKTNAFPQKGASPFPPKPGVNLPPLPSPKKPVVRGKGREKKPDTPFTKEFKSLARKTKLFSYCQKVDILAGIGRYGVLYLGFDDTTDVTLPVTPGAKLVFLQAFREDCASIAGLEGDVTNPRYGLPHAYNLRTAQGLDNANAVRGAYPMTADAAKGQLGLTLSGVHWSRCIHVVDEPDDGELYGTPRLEAVWNRLQDIETAVSASGETFWRSGFQKAFAKIDTGEGVVMSPTARAKFEEKLGNMMNGLQDWVVGQGLDIKTLSGQTADPTTIVTTCLQLIGACKAIPYRILTGSEQGELAGSQDGDAFKASTNARRNDFCVNRIMRPLIDRLVEYKVLPAPEGGEYQVEWTSAEEQAPEVKAQCLTANVGAITAYLSGGGDQLVPRRAFLTDYMDIDPEVAEQYLDEADQAVAQAEIESKAQMELAMEQMPGAEGGSPFEKGKPSSGSFPKKTPFSQKANSDGSPLSEEAPWYKRISAFLRDINPLKRNRASDALPLGTEVEVELEDGMRVNAEVVRHEDGAAVVMATDGQEYTLPQ